MTGRRPSHCPTFPKQPIQHSELIAETREEHFTAITPAPDAGGAACCIHATSSLQHNHKNDGVKDFKTAPPDQSRFKAHFLGDNGENKSLKEAFVEYLHHKKSCP